ncbi:hypothetical protein [Aliivibrio kagoshimensis]|uniref:hypothetical protein n=1 Tax=Aliivibrio kagoshimensis TaxID=2910230 RepID=UPI003D104284
MKNSLALPIIILLLLPACAELKATGKAIGHKTKDVTTSIGHASRDVAKSVSSNTKKVIDDISDETQ